ncbi:hypothetical protein N1Z77_00008620 [Klebsiella pneumoniae]
MNVIHIAETVKGGVATVINNLTENNEIDSHVICPESQSKEIYCAQKTYSHEQVEIYHLYHLYS